MGERKRMGAEVNLEAWTEAQINQAALEEWLGVLARLWTAVGKPMDVGRLEVYRKALKEVPLGLLELAVERVIRENGYNVVPLPGAVWEAVRVELGKPWDVREAMEEWVERRWRLPRPGKAPVARHDKMNRGGE